MLPANENLRLEFDDALRIDSSILLKKQDTRLEDASGRLVVFISRSWKSIWIHPASSKTFTSK